MWCFLFIFIESPWSCCAAGADYSGGWSWARLSVLISAVCVSLQLLITSFSDLHKHSEPHNSMSHSGPCYVYYMKTPLPRLMLHHWTAHYTVQLRWNLVSSSPLPVVEMLQSLHSLQQENQRLQDQILSLTAKKERLQLLNTELAVPFPPHILSNQGSMHTSAQISFLSSTQGQSLHPFLSIFIWKWETLYMMSCSVHPISISFS